MHTFPHLYREHDTHKVNHPKNKEALVDIITNQRRLVFLRTSSQRDRNDLFRALTKYCFDAPGIYLPIPVILDSYRSVLQGIPDDKLAEAFIEMLGQQVEFKEMTLENIEKCAFEGSPDAVFLMTIVDEDHGLSRSGRDHQINRLLEQLALRFPHARICVLYDRYIVNPTYDPRGYDCIDVSDGQIPAFYSRPSILRPPVEFP